LAQTFVKFISLFSGVGGFDLGLEQAGWECVYQVELKKWCYQTLQRIWPDVPKQKDIHDVNGALIPVADVIVFGSPCQDLSLAGTKLGLDGGRSSLFYEATRVIKEIRDATQGQFPKYAIWENVPGAFNANGGADFSKVLDTLAEVGALGIEWACLDAQYFGVPQHRLRLFTVATFCPARSNRGGREILHVQHVGRRFIAKSGDAFRSDPSAPVAMFGGGRTKTWKEREISVTLTATDRRAASNGVMYGTKMRRLTPIEHERLMGWPDNHTAFRADGKKNSDAMRYEMCGNGVVAPVAKWIGEQINLAEIGL
jgi:DNA (cytosine-5)-methyltransferase 1